MNTPARSIADLPQSPFASYAEFVEAHAAGKTRVWIRLDVRRTWLSRQYLFLFMLTWGVLIAIAFAVLAAVAKRWEWLWGSLTSLVAWRFASGVISCCNVAPLLALLLLLLAPFTQGLTLVFAIACLLIWFTMGFALGMIDQGFRDQMLESEAEFLHLWNCGIIAKVELLPEPTE
jgi:hypothetical protein